MYYICFFQDMAGIEWKKLRGTLRALKCSCHVKTSSFLATNSSLFGPSSDSSLNSNQFALKKDPASSSLSQLISRIDAKVRKGPLCIFILQDRKNEEALLELLARQKKFTFLGRGNLHPFLFSPSPSKAKKITGTLEKEIRELETLLSPHIPFSHLLDTSYDLIAGIENQTQDLTNVFDHLANPLVTRSHPSSSQVSSSSSSSSCSSSSHTNPEDSLKESKEE